jgi:hypothetical protein
VCWASCRRDKEKKFSELSCIVTQIKAVFLDAHGIICKLFFTTYIIRMIKARRMRWAVHVARICEMRNEYNILVGMPERKRPLGRPGCRWEDNIVIDLRKIRW